MWDDVRELVSVILMESGIGERLLAKKARSTIVIRRAGIPSTDDSILSYLGGLPRLPPKWSWPEVERREEDGEGEGPISPTFIGQMDLSDVPKCLGKRRLPRKGTIYIFCNTQFVGVEDPYCRVLYYPKSSAKFPERPPPENLMRLGGSCDGRFRYWFPDGDHRAGVEFKFPISFLPTRPNEEAEKDGSNGVRKATPKWATELKFHIEHPLLIRGWPHTPIFMQTFKNALVANIGRAKFGSDGELWSGFSDLAALVSTLPEFPGEPFRWLNNSERVAVRKILPGFEDKFSKLSSGVPVYGLGAAFNEALYYCACLGFLEGHFVAESNSGLKAGLDSAAKQIGEWEINHQMLGSGALIQDAAYANMRRALLLQLSGEDCLGFSGGVGSALQLWVPYWKLKAGKLKKVRATFEC